jgi:hypothetical protein
MYCYIHPTVRPPPSHRRPSNLAHPDIFAQSVPGREPPAGQRLPVQVPGRSNGTILHKKNLIKPWPPPANEVDSLDSLGGRTSLGL